MYTVKADSLQHSLFNLAKLLESDGSSVIVRGYETLELHPCLIEIANPRARTLLYPKRGNNPFSTLAETIWVLAGRDDVNFLSFFLPRAPEFSDDGKVWRAAYGNRLFKWPLHNMNETDIDQITHIINLLIRDLTSRQAVAVIWDPARDATITSSKDFPCSNYLHFMVRNNMLDLLVVIRSNDLIFGYCLSGETKIKLLDGTISPIKDLVGKEFYVYSKSKDGRIVPGKVKRCFSTGIKKVYKVNFSDGTFVKCTDNHKFLMKDGTYKQTCELKVGDSIDSYYFRNDDRGYELINDNGEWKYVHRIMAQGLQKPDISENDHYVVHHKDFDKKNNSPENLEWMGSDFHIKYHAKIVEDNKEFSEEWRMKGNKNRWEKPENHEKQSQLLKDLWKDPKYRESRKPAIEKFRQSTVERMNDPANKLIFGARVGEAVKKAHEEGRYRTEAFINARKKGMTEYNKSAIGRERSRENGRKNGKKNIQLLMDRGLHLDSLKKIHEQGLCWTEEALMKGKRKKILIGFKQVVDAGLELNEENYRKFWIYGRPGWKKALEVFGSIEKIKEVLETYNHTILSVEECGEEETFDMEVEDHHNFMIENGVIVHNSSINEYEFTVLQEIVAACIGVELGRYFQLSDSMHVYKEFSGCEGIKKLDQLIKNYPGEWALPPFEFDRNIVDYEKFRGDISALMLNLDSRINPATGISTYPHSFREIEMILTFYIRSKKKFTPTEASEVWWNEIVGNIGFNDLAVACSYWIHKNIEKKEDKGPDTINNLIDRVRGSQK